MENRESAPDSEVPAYGFLASIEIVHQKQVSIELSGQGDFVALARSSIGTEVIARCWRSTLPATPGAEGSDTRKWDSPYSRQRYERTLSNIKDAKARGATMIALATEGDREVQAMAHHMLVLFNTSGTLSAIREAIPLQLLGHPIGVLVGRDVDQPGKLAKSVAVE